MSDPRLPFDIIAVIVDTLGQEQNMATLKSLSLASSAFSPLCRKYIFATIVLEAPYAEPQRDIGRFVELFCTNESDVPNYVRTMVYRLTKFDLKTEYFTQSLPALMQKIVKVESLTIVSLGMGRRDWFEIPHPLRQAFLQFMRLPTLTHFKIRKYLNFPLSNIISCTSLISLAVDRVHTLDGEPPVDVSSPPRIQEYATGRGFSGRGFFDRFYQMSNTKLANGSAALDFTGLKKLCTQFENDNDVSVIRQLLKATQCLEVLDLEVASGITFKDLAQMTTTSAGTLKTLHVRVIGVNTEQPDPSLPDPFFGLCEELEAMKNCNVVETITVSVGVPRPAQCLNDDGWGKLDRVLDQPGWPKLKHVALNISIDSLSRHRETWKRTMDAIPEKQFAGLLNNKMVDFVFTFSTF
ncbi:hypothetical protein B0H34DRAFT_167798 [Crassisporium funariophilum]|nr:hypothetical protein B0H34DRAFT_167798 [Crassisporium funariophilum]